MIHADDYQQIRKARASDGPALLSMMQQSVDDAALMMNVLKQPDARDWTSLPPDGRDYTVGLHDGVRGLRIAWSPRRTSPVARCR